MALSARELVLIMRARDEASRAIHQVGGSINALGTSSTTTADKIASVGSAMLTLGSVMAGAGAIGVGFFDGAVNGAVEYNKQAALTLTQASNVGTSLEELKQIGKDVASEVPVAFESIQDSLFDIFSTIDTDVPGAQRALELFAKAAVAGDADISSVSRTTLAALNAWQLPVEDTSRLLDLQFKLVEKGAGTYDEFSGAIGRAIPAAVSAGQEVETLAGAMAFLTRNGLSTEMAATSAARAFELLTDPKSTARLELNGVAVKDASGNFRQMNEIVNDLATSKGWAAMTDPQRKQAFKDIFGTGSIQARRFFDTAIPNFEQFNSLTDEMQNSAGALDGAYDIMFNQPANQAALLANKYAILKSEIGDALIPAKMALINVLSSLIDWWQSLDEGTRDIIVKVAAAAAVFMLVAGVIVAAVGAVLLFVGTIAPVVGGITTLIKILAGANAAVLVLAVAAFFLIKHWDKVKAALLPIFNAIGEGIQAFMAVWNNEGATQANSGGLTGLFERAAVVIGVAWDFIQKVFEEVKVGIAAFMAAWRGEEGAGEGSTFATIMASAATILKDQVIPAIESAINWIIDFAGTVVSTTETTITAFQEFWGALQDVWGWLSDTFGPGLSDIFSAIGDAWNEVSPEIIQAAKDVGQAFQDMWKVAKPVLDIIGSHIKFIFGIITTVIGVALDVILGAWRIFGPTLLQIVITAWNLVSAFISNAITIISNTIALFLNLLQGDWRDAWENVKNILKAVGNIIVAIIKAWWATVRSLFAAGKTALLKITDALQTAIINLIKSMMDGLWNKIKDGWNRVENFMGGWKRKILNVFSGAGNWLRQIGKNLLNGLKNGISDGISSVRNKLREVTNLIPSWKGPPEKDAKLLHNNGRLIMEGLEGGLESGWSRVRGFLNGITTTNNFMPEVSVSRPGDSMNDPNMNMEMLVAAFRRAIEESEMNRIGLNVEGDVVLGSGEETDELDWWAQTTNAGA